MTTSTGQIVPFISCYRAGYRIIPKLFINAILKRKIEQKFLALYIVAAFLAAFKILSTALNTQKPFGFVRKLFCMF